MIVVLCSWSGRPVNLLSVFWCKFIRWCSETFALMYMPFGPDFYPVVTAGVSSAIVLGTRWVCFVLSANTWTDTVLPIIQLGLLYVCSTTKAVCCSRLHVQCTTVLWMKNQNKLTTFNTISACYVLRNKHNTSQTTSSVGRRLHIEPASNCVHIFSNITLPGNTACCWRRTKHHHGFSPTDAQLNSLNPLTPN